MYGHDIYVSISQLPGILTLGVDAECTSFVVYTKTSDWKESQSQSFLLLAAAGESVVTMETCKTLSMISHCSMTITMPSSFTSAILQQHIRNVTFTSSQALVGRVNLTASYISNVLFTSCKALVGRVNLLRRISVISPS